MITPEDAMTTPDDLVERVAKAICREASAFYGEEPCWKLGDEFAQEPWPPDCGEHGCFALAVAAIRAMIPSGNDPTSDDTGNAG